MDNDLRELNVFNTLLEMFQQRKYVDIKNNEEEKYLTAIKYIDMPVKSIVKFCNDRKIDDESIEIIKTIYYEIRKNHSTTNDCFENFKQFLINHVSKSKNYEQYKKIRTILKHVMKNSAHKIIAFYGICDKLNSQQINKYANLIDEKLNLLQNDKVRNDSPHYAILVYEILTPNVGKIITKLKNPPTNKHIELFEADCLQFNITKHELVPLQTALLEEDVEKIGISNVKKFPLYGADDPVVLFMGFRHGAVIRVERKGNYTFADGTRSKVIAYRVVR